MEIKPDSEAARRSLKTQRKAVSTVLFWEISRVEGVPKIVLINLMEKLAKDNIMSESGHKGQI